jgi:hypothetical protein
MNAGEIPDDVLRVLIEDVRQCIDKEAELIAELIRQNEGGIQAYNEASPAAEANAGEQRVSNCKQWQG